MPEIVDERWVEVDSLRQALEDNLDTAATAIAHAEAALRALVGDRLYDVEFAEGSGDDIARHLDMAAFEIRAADRARAEAVR